MLETLESPLDMDSTEIKRVHPKGNQSWIFIGRTDSEAPVLWPPDVKSWLTGKDPDAGKDWRQEEKDRGWWMASLTRWTWVWVNSGRWWWTERPGMLRFMGSQRVRHDWATELKMMWDRSSPTRAQTCIPCIARQILNHWTTREVSSWVLMLEKN